MLIGSELGGHGIQIFDMRKVGIWTAQFESNWHTYQLLDVDPKSPVTFATTSADSSDLTGHVGFLPNGSTHNVVINEELNYAVSVGARPRNSTCKSGLIFIDLSDPSNPKDLGCDPQDAYVHDVC